MGRDVAVKAIQAILVLLGLASQAIGVFLLPFHLAPFSFNEAIYGYSSPLVLLPFLIASFLIVTSMTIKVARLKKKVKVSDRVILAYSTVLSILPAWVILFASLVPWYTPLMWVYNPYMTLLPGFYVYVAGCALLVISQTLVPLLAAGHLPAPDAVSIWVERNRASIVGALLVMTNPPLFSFAVWLMMDFYAGSWLLVGLLFILLPITWLIIAVAADMILSAYSRRRFKYSGVFKRRWLIPWTLLLVAIPVDRAYYLSLPFWPLISLQSYQTEVWMFIIGQLSVLVWTCFTVLILFASDSRVFRSTSKAGSDSGGVLLTSSSEAPSEGKS